MQISQEVRDFAAKKEAGLLNSVPSPLAGEGDSSKLSGERGTRQALEQAPTLEEAEAGMAEMSERYREGGNELYVGAGGQEHD